MTITVEEIGKYLGQSVQDMMGRPTGKLVGLTADVKNEVQSIQIARTEGDVTEHPITFVRIIDGHPVLLQAWRIEAEDLKKEHDIIKRRRQAIDLLLKDGDIDQSEYNQLRSGYEDIHKDIITKRDSLVETLKNIEVKLEQQIKNLETALTNNKMLYTVAEIDASTYQTVTESVRAGLEISRKERKDMDNTRESLHDIASLETPQTTNQSSAPNYIPDVVVIKMRESA
ncbi:MAG: CdvA-like protein [Candidatus Bathyarchaeia archaeon]